MSRALLAPPTELRRTPRFKPRGKVRITCHTTVPGPNLASALLDVSLGGLRLKLRETIPEGTIVVIAVQRLNRLKLIRREGTVRWSVAGLNGGCVAGIQLAIPFANQEIARLIEGKDSDAFGLHGWGSCSTEECRQRQQSSSTAGRLAC